MKPPKLGQHGNFGDATLTAFSSAQAEGVDGGAGVGLALRRFSRLWIRIVTVLRFTSHRVLVTVCPMRCHLRQAPGP